MKTKSKKTKLPKQIKVIVKWTDETFDFVEFVERVIAFKKKANTEYPIKEEKIY